MIDRELIIIDKHIILESKPIQDLLVIDGLTADKILAAAELYRQARLSAERNLPTNRETFLGTRDTVLAIIGALK